jgi:hypothetical protein
MEVPVVKFTMELIEQLELVKELEPVFGKRPSR